MGSPQEEFLAFTQQYRGIIVSAIRRVCGAASDSLLPDVEQEVYLALWQRWNDSNHIDYPVSYLYKVAMRTALAVMHTYRAPDVEEFTAEAYPTTEPSLTIDGFSSVERACLLTETPQSIAHRAGPCRARLSSGILAHGGRDPLWVERGSGAPPHLPWDPSTQSSHDTGISIMDAWPDDLDIESWRQAYRDLQSHGSPSCPPDDHLIALVLHERPCAEREQLADHIVSCRRCTDLYRLLLHVHRDLTDGYPHPMLLEMGSVREQTKQKQS